MKRSAFNPWGSLAAWRLPKATKLHCKAMKAKSFGHGCAWVFSWITWIFTVRKRQLCTYIAPCWMIQSYTYKHINIYIYIRIWLWLKERVWIVPRWSGRMERVSYVQESRGLIRTYWEDILKRPGISTDQGYGSCPLEMYGSWVWIACGSRVCIGALHFEPLPHDVCIYIYMGMSINSGMDRSAVIRTMDRECLRKVPDPYPFVRAHHSIQTVLILLLSPTCYYFSSCYSCC